MSENTHIWCELLINIIIKAILLKFLFVSKLNVVQTSDCNKKIIKTKRFNIVIDILYQQCNL